MTRETRKRELEIGIGLVLYLLAFLISMQAKMKSKAEMLLFLLDVYKRQAQGTPDDSGAVFGGVYTSDPVMAGGSAGGADASSASVPRVIVTGFNTEPAEVRAGSNFKLIVHLKNTSSKTAVSNMLFDMPVSYTHLKTPQ